MIKKIISFSYRSLPYLLLVLLLFLRLPEWIKNFQYQNTAAVQFNAITSAGEKLNLPKSNEKVILFFWMSDCGPCKVELERLNQMILNHELNSDRLVLINLGESAETVQQFLLQKKYPFKSVLDSSLQIANLYKVQSTPTVVFIDEKSNISWMSSGLSPSLTIRIKKFFQ